MKTYTLIGTDGTATPLQPGKKGTLTYEELRHYVGGPIERVELKGGWLYVNENGFAEDQEFNRKASRVADLNAKYPVLLHYLHGPAILVKNPSWKGTEPDYHTKEQIDNAERTLKALFKGAV
jgi:hypothetical protein